MIDALPFLKKVTQKLADHRFLVENKEIDHLCYRTSSKENYAVIKSQFAKHSDLLIESEVNGRLIATYKLHTPIQFKHWVIDLIEVPEPKPNKDTKEGYEHIEIVIDESFEKFMAKHPAVKFNQKGLTKDLNPELEIEFDDCAVKFHHKSLEHIINIEKNSLIMKFLDETKILSKFKEYSPCLSGTLPLAIDTDRSDLDILFQTEDLDAFLLEATKEFSQFKNYEHHISENQGLKSLVINFDYDSLPIELFVQNKTSFQQRANQHFLIEGRLLKLLGKPFLEKIKRLKKDGIKTEPAFGKLLNLTEPYQDLVDLNKITDKELKEKFTE